MSIFDSLVQTALQSALGGNAQDQTQNLVKGVVGMLVNNAGGVSGLVDKFTQSGLGEVAKSWIGTGQNQTVTPQQVEQALGADKVAELAQQAGIPAEKGAEVLSQVLPTVVDKMTPDGEIPDEHKMGTLAKVILGGIGVAGAAMAAKAVAGHFGSDDAPQVADASSTIDSSIPASAPATEAPTQVQTYTVVAGDNLSKIAKHFYGNPNEYHKIFEANRDQLSDPDRINVGQVLRIP